MKLSDMSKYKYKTCADLDKEFLTTCTFDSMIDKWDKYAIDIDNIVSCCDEMRTI